MPNPNKRFIFLNSGDISSIEFEDVYETNSESLRLSLDGTKTFVKYDLTIYPIIEGYDPETNEPDYGDNVDENGDTYTLEYDEQNNITGSGLMHPSGTILNRPPIHDHALEISGKTEFTQSEVKSILNEGEDW